MHLPKRFMYMEKEERKISISVQVGIENNFLMCIVFREREREREEQLYLILLCIYNIIWYRRHIIDIVQHLQVFVSFYIMPAVKFVPVILKKANQRKNPFSILLEYLHSGIHV